MCLLLSLISQIYIVIFLKNLYKLNEDKTLGNDVFFVLTKCQQDTQASGG